MENQMVETMAAGKVFLTVANLVLQMAVRMVVTMGNNWVAPKVA